MNSLYFSRIRKSETLDIYTGLNSPLILFSEVDGTALATIHFRVSERLYDRNVKNARTFIAPYPKKPNNDIQHFQGLINKPNQEIELVITNTNPKGYINFNLMKTNETVSETNPGGINEINELRPYESYAVRCDQNNNLPMILKKYICNDTNKTITIKQNEEENKKNGNNTKGTYIFLSVAPQSNDEELVKRFSKTLWKVSDLIPVKPKLSSLNRRSFYNQNGGYDRFRRSLRFDSHFNNLSLESNTNNELFDNLNETGVTFESSYQDNNTYSTTLPQNMYFSNINSTTLPPQLLYESSIPKLNDDIILDSEVGKITYGTEKINVNSMETNITYNYEVTSKHCVLGLSINENIEFINTPNDFLNDLNIEAEKLIIKINEKKYDEFLKGKIFKSDDCVICLESDIDCVLYSCAHKCGHYTCLETLNKCPVCRESIIAKLKQ